MLSRTVCADGDRCHDDDDHIAFAKREQRVIFTQDTDFLRAAVNDPDHCGTAYFPQGKRSFGEVIRHLSLLHDAMEDREMIGRVEYL